MTGSSKTVVRQSCYCTTAYLAELVACEANESAPATARLSQW